MFIRGVMIVFVLTTLFLVPSFAAEPNIKDGMWEITSNMEMSQDVCRLNACSKDKPVYY
jgi:hypothetical protein